MHALEHVSQHKHTCPGNRCSALVGSSLLCFLLSKAATAAQLHVFSFDLHLFRQQVQCPGGVQLVVLPAQQGGHCSPAGFGFQTYDIYLSRQRLDGFDLVVSLADPLSDSLNPVPQRVQQHSRTCPGSRCSALVGSSLSCFLLSRAGIAAQLHLHRYPMLIDL